MDRETLQERIKELARTVDDLLVIDLQQVHALADAFGTVRDVELAALDCGVVPARYARNLGTVGLEGQARLLRATVGVVGLGGLGGYVVEALARMGVGTLILVDGDVFEEHNLNRQLLGTLENLGIEKAQAACSRVARVNAAVEPICHARTLTEENMPELLAGADVVVDALDRLPTRLMLQDGARELGIPMVHGSIAGFLGQVTTVLPGDPGLHALYGDGEGLPEQGLESELGTPATTPMAVAAWEAQEVVKLLTEQGELLRNRLLVIDMESGTLQVLHLG
jgi:molybdopterin/thiamine biosynthesis adenylyltransferase